LSEVRRNPRMFKEKKPEPAVIARNIGELNKQIKDAANRGDTATVARLQQEIAKLRRETFKVR